MMTDMILIKVRGVVRYAQAFSEQIYVCELFQEELWEMCMYTYISGSDSLPSIQTPLEGVQAVYSSKRRDKIGGVVYIIVIRVSKGTTV